MNKRITVLFLFLFFPTTMPLAQEINGTAYEERIEKLERSAREPRVLRAIDTVTVKPGMTIVDIGAGTGCFTFPFAKALKNTGMVFATDIDKNMLEHIQKKIREGHYTNITPVLVNKDTGEPFYQQHAFDIIFLGGVYNELPDPESFLSNLRPSLKKSGRLYILTPPPMDDAIGLILDSPLETIPALFSKGENFPVFKRLSRKIQDFIRNWSSSRKKPDIPDEIRIKLKRDLERMLLDRGLFNDVYAYYKKEAPVFPAICLYGKYPQSFALIQWLVIKLNERDILENKTIAMTPLDKDMLSALNARLLLESFGLTGSCDIRPNKESIIRTLEKAGYTLVKNHFLYFFEFKRKY